MVEVRSGDVDQLRSLLLDGRDYFRVAVAGRRHGDARGKVEKLIAVHVFHADAEAALGHQRIRAGITGRNKPAVRLDRSPGLGSGQRTEKFRTVLGVKLLLVHSHVSWADAVVWPCMNE